MTPLEGVGGKSPLTPAARATTLLIMRSMIFAFALVSASLLAPPLSGQESSYLQEIQQKWQNARDYTLELAEAMLEERYGYAPTEDQMTFRAQLLHIVSNMNWLSSAYLGGEKLDYDLKTERYSKAEMLAILSEGFECAAAAIAQLQAEQLEERVDFFAGPLSKRQILTLMNDHLTHHRGQLAVYLRLQGVKPPRYRGW